MDRDTERRRMALELAIRALDGHQGFVENRDEYVIRYAETFLNFLNPPNPYVQRVFESDEEVRAADG